MSGKNERKKKKALSNVELLAKLSIGKDLFKPFETEAGTFSMRPLSNGEINEIAVLQLNSINVSAVGGIENSKPEDIKVDVNTEAVMLKRDEAKYTAIAYSLSDEKNKISYEHVKNMCVPQKVIDDMFNNVLERSNIQEDVLLPFHQELSRTAVKSSSIDKSSVSKNGN